MTRPRRLRIAAMALAGGLILAEIVATGVAIAHEFTADSRVTLDRSGPRRPRVGRRITFFGEVNSPQAICQRRRGVRLIRIGSGVVATDRSDADGDFSMRVRARRGRYVARVGPRTTGVHPHRHACGGDRSNVVRVRTRPRN